MLISRRNQQQIVRELNQARLPGEKPIKLSDLDNPKVAKIVQDALLSFSESNKEGELTIAVMQALG